MWFLHFLHMNHQALAPGYMCEEGGCVCLRRVGWGCGLYLAKENYHYCHLFFFLFFSIHLHPHVSSSTYCPLPIFQLNPFIPSTALTGKEQRSGGCE